MASSSLVAWTTAVTLFVSVSGAFAQQGSAADREACTPDAFRLCGRYIPDADQVANCLRDAGPRLSPGCYAVFNPTRADAGPRTARRRYVPPPKRYRDDDDED
jgi:hypothetical protein